jgi:nucleoside 2-deoxyribosyltransferase
MNIFLICPVRKTTKEQRNNMNTYISKLEENGNTVFYPTRDNVHESTDKIGYTICETNRDAVVQADEIHIFYDHNSKGSLFDLGMAFAVGKPLKIVNFEDCISTHGKSFVNMMNYWVANGNEY